MEPAKTLAQTLAEAKANANHKPLFDSAPQPISSWQELRLDNRIKLLQISFSLYLISLAMFWCHVLGILTFPIPVVLAFVVVAPANYLLLLWAAYTIQSALRESGLQKHGGISLLAHSFLTQ